jgi:hypothetical protein
MDPMRYQNKWLMGIEILVMIVFVLIMVIPSPSPPRRSAQARCMNNLYQIFLAMEQYRVDWDGALPIPRSTAQRVPYDQSWRGMMRDYVITDPTWCCPKLNDRMAYSLDRRLIGAELPNRSPRKKGETHAGLGLPREDTAIVFETVNDDPRNNNLNGDIICRASADKLPITGSYVVWPDEGPHYFRDWPQWARPRHGGRTLILHAGGHVTCDPEPDFSPK